MPSSSSARRAGFHCPLGNPSQLPIAPAFESYESLNAAVAEFRRTPEHHERETHAAEIFRRLVPLVQKTLRRFCPPARPASRCHPGACLPEDLIGEAYLAFREILERYDPERGVDFLGYATPHLYWSLEHRARSLARASRENAVGVVDDVVEREDEEDRVLKTVLADELLEQLERPDTDLMLYDAAGHSCEEIAQVLGISPAAVRKRLERVRRRLRVLASD